MKCKKFSKKGSQVGPLSHPPSRGGGGLATTKRNLGPCRGFGSTDLEVKKGDIYNVTPSGTPLERREFGGADTSPPRLVGGLI